MDDIIAHVDIRLFGQERNSLKDIDRIASESMLHAFTLSPHAITFYFSSEEQNTTGTASLSIPYTMLSDMIMPRSILSPFVMVRTKDPVTGLTAEQALQLGAMKFCVRYANRNKDDTTSGMCTGPEAFIMLMQNRYMPVEARLPLAQRKLCRKAEELMDGLVDADNDANYAYAGGGTMWTPIAAGNAAHAEEILAKLILSFRAPAVNSPAAHARLAKNLKAIDANLAKISALKPDLMRTRSQGLD